MKKTSTLIILLFAIYTFLPGNKINAQITSLSESFDSVVPADWLSINHSTGPGQGWIQGDVRKFMAYTGDATSYAAAGYESVESHTGNGTINNWLITPELNLTNGSTLNFFTRTVAESTYPDRLEVRLSTNGSSANVGSGVHDVGDFSTLLLSVNPSLEQGGYPDTGWTQFTVSVSGINGTATGRIAFRYYVTNAGSNAINSNYIGLDDVTYEPVLPVTLLNFTGSIINNKAMLTWSVASEINNKGFEVQQSRDNKTFTPIGSVTGWGNTSVMTQYSFTDPSKLLSGTNYYRLKQIDADGSFRYSPVVRLDMKKFDWNIFGNPSANAWIQLQTEAQSNIQVQVVSFNGRVVQTINKGSLSAGTYNIPLSLNNAPHGIYVVRLLVDKNSYSKKFVQ
jgi:hypothetical protein